MTVRPPLDRGTVLVTGASSGIGRELAVQLAPRVEKLVLLARRVDRLEQLLSDLEARHSALKVIVFGVDLSDEHGVARILDRVSAEIGPVDVLVNAAGGGDGFIRSHTMGPHSTSATHQRRRDRAVNGSPNSGHGRGGVLNVWSGAGLTTMPAAASYTGSKHFIDGFSEALRADLAATGVVVTQVCPGPVESEFDDVAGSPGGMVGGLPQFLRITAEQCAREALSGFERGSALVFSKPPVPHDDADGAAVDTARIAAQASGERGTPSTMAL